MSTVFDSELFLRKAFEQEPRKGFELLFRQYYTPLCSHAVRFVYSRQLAEDLVSEVFYQFYRSEAYRNVRSSYISYLFTAVRNEAFTHLKKEFNILRAIRPTDKAIMVLFGYGHITILNHLFEANPRFEVVEVADVLSK